MRAPLASAWAMSEGPACPSLGMKVAPTRSSTSSSGHNAFASAGESRCMSRPKLWAVVAWRLNSVQRSSLQASRRHPVSRQPVARPVSVLESLVEVDRVAEHLGDRRRRAELPDQAGRMPGRAAGQLALLDQHHVGLVVAGEMVRGGAADDAAADHDDSGVGGHGRHAAGPAIIAARRRQGRDAPASAPRRP